MCARALVRGVLQVGSGASVGGAGQQGSERAVEQRRRCLGGEEGADEGGPGVSGTTAERKTRHGEKWAPTSGPGVAAGRVARGAEERWLAGLSGVLLGRVGTWAAHGRERESGLG